LLTTRRNAISSRPLATRARTRARLHFLAFVIFERADARYGIFRWRNRVRTRATARSCG
jgi:hypothetical protein